MLYLKNLRQWMGGESKSIRAVVSSRFALSLFLVGLWSLSDANAQLGNYPGLELPKSREPEAYKAPPSRCERYRGRAFVGGYAVQPPCLAGCASAMVDDYGRTARYELTGARCARSMQPRYVPQDLNAAGAQDEPQQDPRPIYQRPPRVPPQKGQAKNYDEKPIDGVPPGMRAVPKQR